MGSSGRIDPMRWEKGAWISAADQAGLEGTGNQQSDNMMYSLNPANYPNVVEAKFEIEFTIKRTGGTGNVFGWVSGRTSGFAASGGLAAETKLTGAVYNSDSDLDHRKKKRQTMPVEVFGAGLAGREQNMNLNVVTKGTDETTVYEVVDVRSRLLYRRVV